jgi:hypothetical protein
LVSIKLNHLTQLITRENFIILTCQESIKSYIHFVYTSHGQKWQVEGGPNFKVIRKRSNFGYFIISVPKIPTTCRPFLTLLIICMVLSLYF